MVQTSTTIAFAVVALSAASSTMARGFQRRDLGEEDLYNVYRRAASTPAASTVPSTANVGGVNADNAPVGARPSHAGKVLPTKTVHRLARPTLCKPHEKVSWPPHGHHNLLGSAHSHPHSGASLPGGSGSAVRPSQTLAARASVPTPAAAGDVSPTPAPSAHGHHHGAGAVRTVTRAGKDGHRTVYHVLPATRTRCHGPKHTHLAKLGNGHGNVNAKVAAGAVPSASGVRGGQGPSEKVELKQPSEAQASLAPINPKLAARAIDILARYVNDMDELD